MKMEANTGTEHKAVIIRVPDMDLPQKKNITMNIVRARDEVDFECTKEATAKENTTRAMEGDDTVDVLTYLPTGEVVNTVLAIRA